MGGEGKEVDAQRMRWKAMQVMRDRTNPARAGPGPRAAPHLGQGCPSGAGPRSAVVSSESGGWEASWPAQEPA